MPNINESSLKKYVQDNPSHRLFYLVGNDDFLLSFCQRIIASTRACAEIERFDASALDEKRLASEFYNLPLIADAKLIIIDNFMPSALNEHTEALFSSLFAKVPEHISVAACALYDGEHFSPAKKCFELLGSCAVTVEVRKKTGAELVRIVRSFASRTGAEITASAAERLIWLCGNDLTLLKNETEKCAARCGYGEIDEQTVDSVVTKTVESNVYDMIRAISAGKKAQAIDKLAEMFRQKSEPMMLAATLTNSFVNIYRAKCAREAGVSLDGFCKAFAYKPADKKPKIAFDQCAGYRREQLDKIIVVLYELQTALRQSPAEPEALLETALFEIMALRS